MRRWARTNRLTHLGTLTNEDVVTSWSEMERRKERFLERMHEDGYDLPLALVPEPHPGGHGWHLHFGAPCFIPIERLRAWWPYGIVDIRGRRARRAIARRRGGIPGYLSKYIGKGISDEELHGCEPRPRRANRWWHTRGAEPTRTTFRCATLAELRRLLRTVYGEPDEEVPFGEGDAYRPEGYWFHFPDECLRAPPPWS